MSQSRLIGLLGVGFLWVGLGCSNDTQFKSPFKRGAEFGEDATPKNEEPKPSVQTSTQTSTDVSTSTSTSVERDLDPEVSIPSRQTVSFTVAKQIAAVDYLYVLDNSVSMLTRINDKDTVMERIRMAVHAVNPTAYAPNSQIAVMSTMVGNPENLTEIYPDFIADYLRGVTQHEPGFLDFVNKAAIERFRTELVNKDPQNTYLSRWALPGCEQKWFKPSEVECLKAAFQVTGAAVGGEAGTLAVKQLLDKHKNKSEKLFRPNANLNVIFISDTQDPGRSLGTTANSVNKAIQDVIAARPTFAELDKRFRQEQNVRSIKFHSLTPRTFKQGCTEPNVEKNPTILPYEVLAKASGGATEEFCDVVEDITKMTEFLEKMVVNSKAENVSYRLQTKVSKVISVTVNGKAFRNFELLTGADGSQSLVLKGVSRASDLKIDLQYEAKP